MKYDFSTDEYVYTRVNGSEYRALDSFPSIVQNFWTNDPVDWDLEKKITWDELAPSLQELIIRKIKFSDFDSVFQNRVITIETNITTLFNDLSVERNTRQREDELLQAQIDDLKRRMTSAESRLTVLENRMDEAERQIYLIWIEIRKLWQEIYDIWGSDGKIPDHDITHIWEKLRELEDRIAVLEDKVAKLEQEVAKLWIEVNNLWKEIYDIWGSDGKITAHDITEIWKKLKDIESKIGSSSGGGGGGGTVGGPGIIDIFVMNPGDTKEFYIHFTNGFKMLCKYCSFKSETPTWQSDAGTMLGQENNIVAGWMTGFSGFTSPRTYLTFPVSDEAARDSHNIQQYGKSLVVGTPDCPPNVQVESIDQSCLWYSRAYTATSVIWSSTGLYTDGSGYIKAYPMYNDMYIFCMGY